MSKKVSSLRVSKSAANKALAKKTAGIITAVIFGIVAVYVALAAFAVRFVPSDLGMVLVKEPTFEGGYAPVGAHVLVTPEVNESGPLNNLKTAFIPIGPAAITEVEAGPFGTIASSGNLVTVNDRVFEGTLVDTVESDKPREYLANEYLVSCVEGACSEGELYIIKPEQILGVPVNA